MMCVLDDALQLDNPFSADGHLPGWQDMHKISDYCQNASTRQRMFEDLRLHFHGIHWLCSFNVRLKLLRRTMGVSTPPWTRFGRVRLEKSLLLSPARRLLSF